MGSQGSHMALDLKIQQLQTLPTNTDAGKFQPSETLLPPAVKPSQCVSCRWAQTLAIQDQTLTASLGLLFAWRIGIGTLGGSLFCISCFVSLLRKLLVWPAFGQSCSPLMVRAGVPKSCCAMLLLVSFLVSVIRFLWFLALRTLLQEHLDQSHFPLPFPTSY